MTRSYLPSVQDHPVAVFDIDGTIFRSGLYREVIYELANGGYLPKDFRQSLQPFEESWKSRRTPDAYVDFQNALVKQFESCLPDITVHDFESAAATVIKQQSQYVYAFPRELIKELRSRQYVMIAISGSQEELVKPFAALYGFQFWIAQNYGRKNGKFNGQIHKTHMGKDRLLHNMATEHSLNLSKSVGIGDSSGDVSLLETVDYPLAFNPDGELYASAQQHNWPIIIERKNMIYHLLPTNDGFVLAQAGTITAIDFKLILPD